MPASLAASIRLIPGGTSIGFPSKTIVSVSFFGGGGAAGAGDAGVLMR